MCGCVAVATTTEHEFQNNTRNPEDCQHWWVKFEIAAGNRRRALRPRPTLMIVRSFPRVANFKNWRLCQKPIQFPERNDITVVALLRRVDGAKI
jgi:hypothetical protein